MEGFDIITVQQPKQTYVLGGSTSLYWIKIGGMAMSIISTIWTILVLLANMSILAYSIKYPTVQRVITFSNCIIFLLYVAFLLVFNVLNVVLTSSRSIFYTARDDLLVVVSALLLFNVGELIYILVWSYKMVSLMVNVSIVLTVVYPMITSIIFLYTLFYLTSGPAFIPVPQSEKKEVKH